MIQCSVQIEKPDQDVHAELATNILAALYDSDRSSLNFPSFLLYLY